jgi:PAS domain S-box-containing protein
MKALTTAQLRFKIADLENRLAESEQLIEAIKAGEVDAFAISSNNHPEIYTLQSGDYAYRILIEEFSEGAINVSEEGLIVYTNNYFCELLKLSYEEVVGATIFDFVHESSSQDFNELFTQALVGKSKGEIKLIVNNNVIPVYISLTSLQPKLATIGIIITDLTEKKNAEETILDYQKNLEATNHELLQSNEELASFAYLASHDLQEPLRKIETFCQRIIDKEAGSFSPNAQDYFQRIISASKRMHNLISALLNYSRISTSETIRETTDLNLLLADVKNDLQLVISDNNAVIQSSILPVINIIPHQISQLFSNLILNAIKYKRKDIDPIIRITSQIALPAEINIVQTPNAKYLKIEISDNGIGFEQQYSTRIFELFQRLHTKAEYEGTGIGLAICKKIVQNHQGVIKAFGKSGEGATFDIYLPFN